MRYFEIHVPSSLERGGYSLLVRSNSYFNFETDAVLDIGLDFKNEEIIIDLAAEKGLIDSLDTELVQKVLEISEEELLDNRVDINNLPII